MSELLDGQATIVVELPVSVIGVESAKRAAYVFMDRATVIFEDGPSGIRCILHQANAAAAFPGTLERDFRRELIDQELRIEIEARTQSMRDAILGLAFSRTGLQA